MPAPLNSVGLALSLSLALGIPFVTSLVCSRIVVAQTSTNQERKAEADSLYEHGIHQTGRGDFKEALQSWQQALAIYRQIQDRVGEMQALDNLGTASMTLNSYSQAINYFQQELAIAREVKDHLFEERALSSLSAVDRIQNSATYKLEKADQLLFYQGAEQYRTSQFEAALRSWQQALTFYHEIGNPYREISALSKLANAYRALGSYAKAIEYGQQSLSMARKHSNDSLNKILVNGEVPGALKLIEDDVLTNVGDDYFALGNYPKALEYYQQGLAITQEVSNPLGTWTLLNNVGRVYYALGDYAKAVDYQQQSLAAWRTIHGSVRELGRGRALDDLGRAYYALGDYAKAVDYQQQSLDIARTVKDRQGEGQTLDNLGLAYLSLSDYSKAIKCLQQSLAIAREIKDREGEGLALNDIGLTTAKQQQLELAIVFYKQSVNVREGIRQDIRSLDRNLQESYTQSIAYTYRQLADILIAQGRIGEAQQVLERLKIQELNDFTKGTRAPKTVAEVGFNAAETQIKGKYTSLIAFGGQFYDCEQQRCAQYNELKTQYQSLSKEFQAFVEQTKQQLRDSRLTQVDESTQDFQTSADRVVTAHPHSILIYPLVLDDKTRLLWASKGGVLSKTAVCNLGAKALYNKVAEFQTLISHRGDETQLKAVGKDLYDCLIKPLESELSANQIKHLIFVPDRATNYIPMGALFDGNQYLIQRFAVSNILSAGLTDTDDRLQPPQNTPVLALGLTQSKGNFGALPSVAAELKAIVKQAGGTGIYPGDEYLDQAFTKDALEDNIRGHRIVHIATHGEFKPANPRDSYFLLGTGIPYPIQDVQTLRGLKTVHLVVLSACQTGLGGADGLGLEVSGMSSFFMGDRDRAKAVIASLWSVNDSSTAQLMQQFYQNLAIGTMTKAEALRQAQLSVMGKSNSAKQSSRGDSFKLPSTDGSKPAIAPDYSHPYYWAPFILIGNGL